MDGRVSPKQCGKESKFPYNNRRLVYVKSHNRRRHEATWYMNEKAKQISSAIFLFNLFVLTCLEYVYYYYRYTE